MIDAETLSEELHNVAVAARVDYGTGHFALDWDDHHETHELSWVPVSGGPAIRVIGDSLTMCTIKFAESPREDGTRLAPGIAGRLRKKLART